MADGVELTLDDFYKLTNPEKEVERKRVLGAFNTLDMGKEELDINVSDIEILLDQFAKGEIDIGQDANNLNKMAAILSTIEKDKASRLGAKKWKLSPKTWYMNWSESIKRRNKIKGLKRRTEKLTKARINNNFDVVRDKLKYYGEPVTDADKKEMIGAIANQQAKIDNLNKGNWAQKGWKNLKNWSLGRVGLSLEDQMEKINPELRKKKAEKDLEKAKYPNIGWQTLNFLSMTLSNRIRRRMNEKAVDPRAFYEKKASTRAAKIEELQNKVAGSKWYGNPINKIKLARQRWLQNKDLKKMYGNSLYNNLEKDAAALKADIEALSNLTKTGNAGASGTKMEMKVREQQKAQKLAHLKMLEDRMLKLKNNHDKQSGKVKNKFLAKEEKLETQINTRYDSINKRSRNIEDSTFRGRAVERLLAIAPNDTVRKQLEETANGIKNKTITDDQEFITLLTEQGFKQEDLQNLQLYLDHYNTETKDRIENKKKEKEDENQETTTAPDISSNSVVTDKEDEEIKQASEAENNQWHQKETETLKNSNELEGYDIKETSEDNQYKASLKKGDREIEVDKKNPNVAVVKCNDENGDKFPTVEEFQAIVRTFKANGEKSVALGKSIEDDEFKARLMIAIRKEGMEISGFDKNKDLSIEMKDLSPETRKELRAQEVELMTKDERRTFHQKELELGLCKNNRDDHQTVAFLSELRGAGKSEDEAVKKLETAEKVLGMSNDDYEAYKKTDEYKNNKDEDGKQAVDHLRMKNEKDSKFDQLSPEEKAKARTLGLMIQKVRGLGSDEKKKVVKRDVDTRVAALRQGSHTA